MSPRTHWRHMGKLKTKKGENENFPRKNQNQLLTILIPVLWCYYLKLRERVELNYHSSKALRAFSSRWTMYIRRLFHVRYSIASLKIENSIYFCLVPRKLKVEGEQKKEEHKKKVLEVVEFIVSLHTRNSSNSTTNYVVEHIRDSWGETKCKKFVFYEFSICHSHSLPICSISFYA